METTEKVYLYGASGHAKVVLDVVSKMGLSVPCLIDDNVEIDSLLGLPVVHDAKDLSPMVITIGDCQIRRRIAQSLGECRYFTAIHPDAIKAKNVQVGQGSVIMAGAILQPFVTIGNHCIINTGASVDHDVKIGDFVHIAPHCTLCGEVRVGDATWVGAGTTVIQGIKIGKDCFIGAGSVVVKDVPDNTLCFGNPAREIRRINLSCTHGENRLSVEDDDTD